MEMVQQHTARTLRSLGVTGEQKSQELNDEQQVDEEWLKNRMAEDRERFIQSNRELLDDGQGKACRDDLSCIDAFVEGECEDASGVECGEPTKKIRKMPRQRRRKGRKIQRLRGIDTDFGPCVQRNHHTVANRALVSEKEVTQLGLDSATVHNSSLEWGNSAGITAPLGSNAGITAPFSMVKESNAGIKAPLGSNAGSTAPNSSLERGRNAGITVPLGSNAGSTAPISMVTTSKAGITAPMGSNAGTTAPSNIVPESNAGITAPLGSNAGITAPSSSVTETMVEDIPPLEPRRWEACDIDDDDESSVEDDSRVEDDYDDASDEEEDNLPRLLPREATSRLQQPRMNSGEAVTGATKERHRKENKQRRREAQQQQGVANYWTDHVGEFNIPTPKSVRGTYKGQMCPSGLALEHPAADVLLQYSQGGCPVQSGKDWTIDMMTAAVERGPHVSALVDEAMLQLQQEVAEKVRVGQARVVNWDDIKSNPPSQLKVSPIAMIPHKSKPYRPILDLSFGLQITPHEKIPSVNESSVKAAPAGAIDQLGHSLARIIHAFAQADDDKKIFMAKWDIKDGFWRLDCEEGAEWNFAYVLPQKEGEPIKLVIPTSLQMGWIESPPYFCAASETGRDIASQYAEAPVGSLENHKFISLALQGTDYESFMREDEESTLRYMIEVYVDDYISLAIPRSKDDLRHVANAVLTAIHDVFPPDEVPEKDPISYKKLLKLEGMWALTKDILGFTFDGVNKTIWLEAPKRDQLLSTLKHWLSQSRKRRSGVPFDEFRSVLSKLRHAFIAIPGGKGLLSPCNTILRKQPDMVFLHHNRVLRQAISDCRSILRESTLAPTKCKELVVDWPDYVGVKDASGYGVGGIIVGEAKSCIPTVFRMEWPDDIRAEINSDKNPNGKLTNSDLECAGMLLLWLVMEDVCNIKSGDHAAVFSDNQPTVSWVKRLASKSSVVAGQLVRALALRMKMTGASPLTPLHIRGVQNAMTDIPSRSFGQPKKWHCRTDAELLTMFDSHFPLPNQQCWTVYQISSALSTKILSVLRMKLISLDEWRRLPSPGRHIGVVGASTSKLWEWTLTFREPHSKNESAACQDLQQSSATAISIVNEAKSELQQSVALSQPLARRVPWTAE